MWAWQPGDLAAPGALAGLTTLVGIVLKLMLDARRDGYVLADERAEDAREQRQHTTDEIRELKERVALLEKDLHAQRVEFDARIMEQRSLKHGAMNDLMRCELLLDTVRRLAPNCTCGALDPVSALLDRRDQA